MRISVPLKALSIFLIISIPCAFAGNAQIARFSKWFDILEKNLAPSDANTAANLLFGGYSRTAAFNLQALGKIYHEQDKDFKKLRTDFKNLEDAIGDYDKWSNILTEGTRRNLKPAKLAKLQKKKLAAKENLKKLLIDNNWLQAKKVKQYKDFIKKFKFGSYRKDKKYILDHLINSMDDLDRTDYDMTILENGNGLHELRRELRWFVIKALTLNGLIIFKENPRICPIQRFQKLPFEPIAHSKYSRLVPTSLESKPCKVSQCLFLAMVQKIEQLGNLKDKIEQDLNLRDVPGDETPEEYLPELYELYDELIETDLLAIFSSELKSCI